MNSIVQYFAEHEGYKCGYCKSLDTNFSHGLWAYTMTVSDYQDLIDRGWRRSGKYCYKPTMEATCCPSYTIRCKALEFKASKSQKKVMKRFNKYLEGKLSSNVDDSKMSTSSTENEIDAERELFVEPRRECKDIDVIDIVNSCTDELDPGNSDHAKGDSEDLVKILTPVTEKKISIDSMKQKDIKKGSGPDPNKLPCKKAKHLRRERKLEKLKEKGVDITMLTSKKPKEKQIEDYINELPSEFQQRLKIKLVRTAPPSPQYLATAKETHELYVKYQITVHNDKPEKCVESKFADFLVKSPLLEEHSESGPTCGYGSFHQQYWLDDKLVAVGVIDILPKCVSSVYFFYDPQYMNLTLGTYGALRELDYTRQLHAYCPQLQYYYMGFYIHSCPKMRYKGNYHPSELLCPETYKWFPMEACIPKLEKSPYTRLDPDIDSIDENYPPESIINYIPVLAKDTVLLYKMYKKKQGKHKDSSSQLINYSRLVGAKSAKSMIFLIDAS